MAMDFFESQDVARRKSGRLVVMFALAVIAIIGLLYLAFVVILGVGQSKLAERSGAPAEPMSIELWDPQLLLWVGLGTIALIGVASLYKINILSAGGRVVAESLDGKLLDPGSTDPQHRLLLNVVQEMAIAAGTPVPPVYLIDESGINAFAAGYSIDDAVIGITRGAVETLSRDELQGVIAHEFSHILNGDMRLNIRIMGIIHGILVIGIVGYFMLRIGFFSGATRSRNDRNEGKLPIALLGLAIMIIGFVGTFFGKLIKAAVSRQREFLADASAVQFTRNPGGIAGALKKIGGWKKGSQLDNPNAQEVSHLLFGSGLQSSFSAMFATHPPLEDRIRRIEPGFKGNFERTRKLTSHSDGTAGIAGFAGGAPSAFTEQAPAATGLAQIGQPSQAHLDYAAKLIASLPPRIVDLAHEPFGARALIYALLINAQADARAKQLQRLRQFADAAVYKQFEAILPLVEKLDATVRLPLIDLTIPALRQLSSGQYGSFAANIDVLVKADDQIDLFEWTLHRILRKHLDRQYRTSKRRSVRHISLRALTPAYSRLLSTLAYLGGDNEAQAAAAFQHAAEHMQLPGMTLQAPENCGLDAVATALDQFGRLSPRVAPRATRRLLEACAACIAADGKVTVTEAELFRAICDSLDCPMPPLLPGQPLG